MDTYLHNWNQINQLCVEIAVIFLQEERSSRFWEMRRQAVSWVGGIQFELYKLSDPEIVALRAEFEKAAGLHDTIFLTMLNHNNSGDCVDQLVQKYLKQDARQEWFNSNGSGLIRDAMRDVDEQMKEFEKKLED